MYDARQSRGGGKVAHNVHVVVRLQERGRNAVGDGSLDGFLDDFGLFLSPCREENLAGGENRGHTHCDGTGRNGLTAAEAARHFLARSGVDEDDTRGRIERRTGLVRGDVAHAADAEEHDVDAVERADALLVEPAVLLYALLLDGAVGREDVLLVDINVVEESLAKLSDGALRGVFGQGEILVGIENHHVLEAHAPFLVHADELFVERRQRSAGSQAQHAVFAFFLLAFDFFDNSRGNGFHGLFHFRIDVRRHLLHARNFAAFHRRARAVECFGYFIQYDL